MLNHRERNAYSANFKSISTAEHPRFMLAASLLGRLPARTQIARLTRDELRSKPYVVRALLSKYWHPSVQNSRKYALFHDHPLICLFGPPGRWCLRQICQVET